MSTSTVSSSVSAFTTLATCSARKPGRYAATSFRRSSPSTRLANGVRTSRPISCAISVKLSLFWKLIITSARGQSQPVVSADLNSTTRARSSPAMASGARYRTVFSPTLSGPCGSPKACAMA
nr:hypothetical protein CPGR_05791 [Mycolicibacter nonchromogenicus]